MPTKVIIKKPPHNAEYYRAYSLLGKYPHYRIGYNLCTETLYISFLETDSINVQ